MNQERKEESNAMPTDIDNQRDDSKEEWSNETVIESGEIIEVDENIDTSEVIESDEILDTDEIEDEKQAKTDWKDAYIRIAADFDNYRKRTSKEFDDVRRRERERVIAAWLEVYDNTERAIATLPEKTGPWYEGFKSLLAQMDKCLASFNIRVTDDLGKPFDPNRHEAIATMPDPEKKNNTILFVERQGFAYENGDVARVARVVVVKNPS